MPPTVTHFVSGVSSYWKTLKLFRVHPTPSVIMLMLLSANRLIEIWITRSFLRTGTIELVKCSRTLSIVLLLLRPPLLARLLPVVF